MINIFITAAAYILVLLYLCSILCPEWLREKWRRVPVGTRSVLFGAHCFFIHPFYVAAAWWKLYGFPFDPRLWVAFFVHDIGYLGKPDMDGEEGERHVELGARIMQRLFDRDKFGIADVARYRWHDLSLYHSRHYAKIAGAKPSRLCFADKLAFCYQIKPLYLWMTKTTGELDEYLKNAKYWHSSGEYVAVGSAGWITADQWYDDLCIWIEKYVEYHKNGAEDTITVNRRTSGAVY